LVIGHSLGLGPPAARAHPVPRTEHDRNLTVTWRPDGVFVQYRLEIDEYTLLTSTAKWVNESATAAPEDTTWQKFVLE